MTPPGRGSILQNGMVAPFGPHQRARCSHVVQASKTRPRGASSMRVRTSSPSADRSPAPPAKCSPRRSSVWSRPSTAPNCPALAAMLLPALVAAMLSLLGLELAQVVVQAIEALIPETPIVLHPVGDLLQRTRVQPAGAPLRLAAAGDQARALQNLQMLGDG